MEEMMMNHTKHSQRTTGRRRNAALLSALSFVQMLVLALLASCSSIDCPLNNRVAAVYKLMGDAAPLSDSLTISTIRFDQSDTVLLNRAVGIDSFLLPMSYNRQEDVLFFRRSNATGWSVTDTVIIEKEDVPHFEAVDCNPSYFHVIRNVRHTRLGIDSIVINQPKVTYDATKSHLYVYFKYLYQ